MLKLISKIALLITILAILYLVISGNLFTASPFVIAGQLLAVALSIWARQSFQFYNPDRTSINSTGRPVAGRPG
jgi:hypothetical protein